MVANFLFGKVLIIDTGYYAQRLYAISNQHKKFWAHKKSRQN